ncbi:MAG: UDP-3-O-[3-hydroxymyristoyl] N-acetylglucosamine deacetylase [Veillonella sp.]|uniref:UDP-3-O-acyl-N-acetylglucosamine deacetylase n=1 Tax=Veillonella sp. TaxID=1926307 RepID=UPI0025CCC48B|nr:UDP-3-O-acyl-N-acetylglucosamine deacetylase [Veillonella sp.]MBS4913584.1 UDP-3-O-[3-hydroxymyristoyl] N-acetylglucosamine deacetylase [Veillonella sp.]
MVLKQKTLLKPIQYKGTGLHSGLPVTMTLRPAEAGTGIVFIRTDLPGAPSVKAIAANVTSTNRATTLEDGEAKVFTVEHLLAAFYGLQIDNCYVELDSPEPPVGDGSAAVFTDLMKEAGIEELDADRAVYAVKRSHAIYDKDRYILIVPYDGLRVTFTSVNSHPLLGTQQVDILLNSENFETDIAPARTIGFMSELKQLQEMGLAKGGSLENVLVYDETTCLSVPRFDDELVRHKILDVLGDLFLLGPIKGHIIALKSSHELNSRLAREILAEMKEN